MHHSDDPSGREEEIVSLLTATFTDSEGAEEGALIETLSRGLLTGTPDEDRYVFTTEDEGRLIGGIVFSRMSYADDPRTVFVLAPVAVATDRHGQGVGTALLRFGLDRLRRDGVDVALTYGDPNYYGRVGYAPITEAEVAAPFPLKYPHGWLGQSLTDAPLTPLKGPASCVRALSDPAYW